MGMKKLYCFTILVFGLILPISQMFSQSSALRDSIYEGKPQTTFDLLTYDTNQTFKSVGHAFTRPFHWKSKDYGNLSILFLGTAALSAADYESNRFFMRQQSEFPKIIRDFGWYFGSPQNYFMANAGLYGIGLFTKNEHIRKTSVLIISSSITTGILQTFLKTAVGRARPETGTSILNFKPFSKEGGYHSFPSGHTVLSVTMAHAVAKQFQNIWLKVGIYGIGAIPPLSRLVDGAHWLTDVAFSAALSIIVVDSINNFLFSSKAYNPNKSPKKISWNFTFGQNTIGFRGNF